MKTASVNTVHSANSYQSKPLLRGITQTNLHGQNIAGTSLHSSNSNPIDGLSYLAMILSHVFSKINVSFNTVTKRLKENKKKYDELSALVKPVDEVVDKMAKLAIDHAGDPKFTDPTTALLEKALYSRYAPNHNNLYTRVFQPERTEKIRIIIGSLLTEAYSDIPGYYNWSNYKSQLNVTIPTIVGPSFDKLNSFPGCSKKYHICNTFECGPVYIYKIEADRDIYMTSGFLKRFLRDVVEYQQKRGFHNIRDQIRCGSAAILYNDIGGIYSIIDQMERIKYESGFDPSLAVLQQTIITDDDGQKIIDLVEYLQPSNRLTLAQLKDVGTALKLSELRSIVNDGRKKMFSLNALKDTDTAELKAQVSNIQVVSELVSGLISNFKTVVSSFAQHMS